MHTYTHTHIHACIHTYRPTDLPTYIQIKNTYIYIYAHKHTEYESGAKQISIKKLYIYICI